MYWGCKAVFVKQCNAIKLASDHTSPPWKRGCTAAARSQRGQSERMGRTQFSWLDTLHRTLQEGGQPGWDYRFFVPWRASFTWTGIPSLLSLVFTILLSWNSVKFCIMLYSLVYRYYCNNDTAIMHQYYWYIIIVINNVSLLLKMI